MTDLPRHGEVLDDVRAEPNDEIMWSVTTILKVLDKSDVLINWACGVQAERTIANLKRIYGRLKNEGEASAVEYVAGLRWQTDGLLSDSALGTLAHGLFDTFALSGSRPDVVAEMHPSHARDDTLLDERDVVSLERMLDQFSRFLDEFQPDYLATECVVYSPTYRYAGQADAFAAFDHVPYIVDYKTSRKSWTKANKERGPYPEAGLQLAAYRYAECAAIWRARRYQSYSRRYYLLSDTERDMAVPVPEVEGGVAVYVTPERYGVYPMRCGPDMFEAFLFVLEAARWQFNVAKHVVGNPLDAPHPRPIPPGDPFAGLPK